MELDEGHTRWNVAARSRRARRGFALAKGRYISKHAPKLGHQAAKRPGIADPHAAMQGWRMHVGQRPEAINRRSDRRVLHHPSLRHQPDERLRGRDRSRGRASCERRRARPHNATLKRSRPRSAATLASIPRSTDATKLSSVASEAAPDATAAHAESGAPSRARSWEGRRLR